MGFATVVQTTFCVLATLTAAAAVYAISCWLHPLRLCRACRGSGRQKAAIFQAYRVCNYCAGTGTRNRAGRAIYQRLNNRR